MPEIKPDIETFANIKVVGVGGSGGSAVNRMIQARLRGVDFIAVNTDVQALHTNQATQKIHIGKEATRGLGAGMNPELGRRAAEENQNDIREALEGADMVFITCGLGGGTGTGAAPIIAEIARELGALTIAVVTKPFDFEGPKRREIAGRGYGELSTRVDTIITIPNERLFQIIDKKTSLLDAFNIADEVLRHGVQGISEIITVPGLINVDFADVRAIMEGTGSSLMGIGQASGEGRAVEAAKAAVESPLLDVTIDGAKGILFTVTGGNDLGMHEVNEAAKVIAEQVDSEAKIIFGANIDENLKDEVKITVIATGFDDQTDMYSRDIPLDTYQPVGGGVSRPDKVSKPEKPASPLSNVKSIFNRKPETEALEDLKPSTAKRPKVTPEVDLGISPDQPEDKHDEDLDIPAFIRRKMG
jgi:cell division protein FtsZ